MYSLRSGGSQFTLTSQWESRKVRTSPLAIDAPKRRVRMSPSLFLVRTILTLEKRAMYSSSLSFKCSGEEVEKAQRRHRTSDAAALQVSTHGGHRNDESELAYIFLLSSFRGGMLRFYAEKVSYFTLSKELHKLLTLPLVWTLEQTQTHQSSPMQFLLAGAHQLTPGQHLPRRAWHPHLAPPPAERSHMNTAAYGLIA